MMLSMGSSFPVKFLHSEKVFNSQGPKHDLNVAHRLDLAGSAVESVSGDKATWERRAKCCLSPVTLCGVNA